MCTIYSTEISLEFTPAFFYDHSHKSFLLTLFNLFTLDKLIPRASLLLMRSSFSLEILIYTNTALYRVQIGLKHSEQKPLMNHI